ncbi:MAG: hypothetical protein IID15_09405, partial [Candidatus Marinimicrobia bacterium]|nr:hypothetical protein [Candidatus Neomarinimicrobiota bacterium]
MIDGKLVDRWAGPTAVTPLHPSIRQPLIHAALLMPLLLWTLGCAGKLSDPEKQAIAILARAHDLMGGQALIDSIHTLQVTAASTDPRGPFVTHIASRANGDLTIRQVYPKWGQRTGGIIGNRYWRQEIGGEILSLDWQRAYNLLLLDFHRLVINMDQRFSRIKAEEEVVEFFGVPSLKIVMRDGRGLPAAAYFSKSIGLPLGIEFADAADPKGPPLVVKFGIWQNVGDVILFKQAILEENDYTYQYNYTDIRINGNIDALLIHPDDAVVAPPDSLP